MTRLGGWAAGIALTAMGIAGAAPAPKRPGRQAPLPTFGTKLSELPPGSAKAVADRACLQCHSADMLRQQHLTEKQWTSEVTKMAGWGAEVKEEEKKDLIAYFVKNFGTDAPIFQPVETQAFASSRPAH